MFYKNIALMQYKKLNAQVGIFHAIDSFAIVKKHQFYIIGELQKGKVQENWFVNVPLNNSIHLSLRISTLEQVTRPSDDTKYILLII